MMRRVNGTYLNSTGNKSYLSSKPSGLLLGKPGIFILLSGLIVGAWQGRTIIVILLGFTLSAACIARLWSRFSLKGVSCAHLVSVQRVFPGEHIKLKLELANRKLLPLPWIQLSDEVPLSFSSNIPLLPGNRPGTGFLSKIVAMLWYTKVSWQVQLCCHKRGYYQLGPITLTSGDIFGFYPRSITKPIIDHITVYPKIFPIKHLRIPSLYPVGETIAERRIFEDPIRVCGIRDYTPHDSRRHIHWKATARHQKLQVKVFEPTTTLKTAIFLSVDSFKAKRDGEVYSEEEFEFSISVAASIANHLIEHHNAVGMFVNSCLADSGQPATLLPAGGTEHLIRILEALAKVTSMASAPFEEFLESERKALPWGTSLILILAKPSEPMRGLLAGLKESGHKLLVFQIGQTKESPPSDTVAWHQLRHPVDFTMKGTEKTG